MIQLAKIIQSQPMPKLARIVLGKNGIGDSGVAALAAAISAAGDSLEIRDLDLDRNVFGDAGMTALAAACASPGMKCLQKMSLAANGIGDAGLVSLAGAISAGALREIEFIDLNGNQVTAIFGR